MVDVVDPLAGSYYVESLTNEIENAAWAEFDKIEKMGGAVAAIEAIPGSGGGQERATSVRKGWKRERVDRGRKLFTWGRANWK